MKLLLLSLFCLLAQTNASFVIYDPVTGKDLMTVEHRKSYNLAELGLGENPILAFKFKTDGNQDGKSAMVKFKGRSECQRSNRIDLVEMAPTKTLDVSTLGSLGRVKLVAEVFPRTRCRGDKVRKEVARIDLYYDASEAPSSAPSTSLMPSASPSVSSEPTTSSMPTTSDQPSLAPTASSQPSSSFMPSTVPSFEPTNLPTSSSMPTIVPASKVWLNEIHSVSRKGEVNEGIEYAITSDVNASDYYVFHYDITADALVMSVTLDMFSFTRKLNDGSGMTLIFAEDGGSPDDEVVNAPAAYGIYDIVNDSVVELVVVGVDTFDKKGTVLEVFEWDYVIYLEGEDGNDPDGLSLQRRGRGCKSGDFQFKGPMRSSFGSVNTGQIFEC